MATNTGVRTARVAGIIGAVKWVLIVLTLIGAGVGFLVAAGSGEEAAIGIAFLVAIGSVMYAVGIWVLFGWFELTLRALGEIADNTAPAPQVQYQQQPYPAPPPY